MNEFFGKNIISVNDFDKHQFESIFDSVDKIIGMNRNQRTEIAKGMVLGYMFFEASTRTRLSFEAAMALVGGTSLGISDVITSSVKKGETLADTVKVLSSYVDVLVLRPSLDGSSRFAAEVADKPVINAGSGTEEHPTQTILDLFTIRKEKKKIDGLKIGITGDLKYGRTNYSLLYALRNYDVDVHLISPESLRVRSDAIYDIKKQISYTESTNLDEYISDLDVLYVTRIQKERFPDDEEYVKVKGSYVIDSTIVKKMKDDSIIMHPLPRVDEISVDVDNTKQARYFEQAEYGKYTRAALLGLILNEKGF